MACRAAWGEAAFSSLVSAQVSRDGPGVLATIFSVLLLALAADPAPADAPAADAPAAGDAAAAAAPSHDAPAAKAEPPAAPAPVDPLQSVKDAILRALAVSRRGGPAEKALPGATSIERFLAALTEPNDEVAWPLFKQLAIDAPREPWGEIGMAHVYVRWHIRDQADKSFARALKIAPDHPIALVEKAIGERVFGNGVAAKEDALKVLARDPNDARALLLLAQLAEDAGAPRDELEAAYQAALAASADLYEARLWLATLAEQQGDTKAALEAVEALAQMNPGSVPMLRRLAGLRRVRGDNAGAAAAYEIAISHGDATKETWSGLAAARRALKDSAGEEQALRRWRRIDPKERSVVVRLFVLRAQAHDGAGMEEFAHAMLAFDPKDAGAHLELAARKAEAGDLLGQLDELKAAASGNAHPEAKTAPEHAASELAALRARLQLPVHPLAASTPDGIYHVSERHLVQLYEQRRASKPELAGKISVQLKISSAGSADSVEVTEDTLHEPELSQELVAALREGEWPKAKKTLTLKYALSPPGTHLVEGSDAPAVDTAADKPRKISKGGKSSKSSNSAAAPAARTDSVSGLGGK